MVIKGLIRIWIYKSIVVQLVTKVFIKLQEGIVGTLLLYSDRVVAILLSIVAVINNLVN